MAENSKLERKFQSELIKIIKQRFEGCVVIKTDPNYIQGFPDLLILYKDKWASLETKRFSNAHRQPNQEWWVDKLDHMSYGAFIFPENMEEVLYELQQTFQY